MKKDWTYKKLGEVCDILNGYAFKSNKYVDDGIRVIRIANVQKGIIVDDQPAFYPLSTQSEIDKYILNEGDILMSLTGNVGRVGILQKEMLPAALNQRVACLRMSDNSLYSKFFFHYLNSDLFEQKCIASARGIAQLNMSTEWLKEQFIPIPPLSIQRSIVAELDLLHSVISKKKEQLRELDNLAQSLFYQMFGDPLDNDKKWSICKLGDLSVKIANGYNAKLEKDTYKVEGIPYFRCQNIWWNRIDYSDIVYIDEATNSRMKSSTLMKNDLIISKIGRVYTENSSLGRTAIYEGEDKQANISGNLCFVRLNKSVNPKFVLYILTMQKYRKWAMKNTPGGIDKRAMSVGQISNFPIILPPLSLQQSFAAKVEAIEAQKQAITQSIHHTEALLAQRMDNYFGI